MSFAIGGKHGKMICETVVCPLLLGASGLPRSEENAEKGRFRQKIVIGSGHFLPRTGWTQRFPRKRRLRLISAEKCHIFQPFSAENPIDSAYP